MHGGTPSEDLDPKTNRAAVADAAPPSPAGEQSRIGAKATARLEPTPYANRVVADHMAGKACEEDSDCATGRCASKLHVQETRAKQGYCTTDCASDARCGLGGECSVPAGEDEGECLATCESNDDCGRSQPIEAS